jgi:hypothetical protein
MEQVFAEAYRAYLKAVREGLENVDIEAIDISRQGTTVPSLYTYYTWHTFFTWHTWHCWHTINTINTINTVSTESSLGQ